MKRKFIWRGKWVEVHKRYGKDIPQSAGPAIFADTINPRYCDATGKYYESRSEMNREIKESGAAPVSWDYTAPDSTWKGSQEEIREDLTKTYYDLRDGNSNDLTEVEKQTCKEIDDRLGWKSNGRSSKLNSR